MVDTLDSVQRIERFGGRSSHVVPSLDLLHTFSESCHGRYISRKVFTINDIRNVDGTLNPL